MKAQLTNLLFDITIVIIMLVIIVELIPFFVHFGTMDPEYKEAFSSLVNAIDNNKPFFIYKLDYNQQNYNIIFSGNEIEVYNCQSQEFSSHSAFFFIYNTTLGYLDRMLDYCYLVYRGIINQNYNITLESSPEFLIGVLQPSSSSNAAYVPLFGQSTENVIIEDLMNSLPYNETCPQIGGISYSVPSLNFCGNQLLSAAISTLDTYLSSNIANNDNCIYNAGINVSPLGNGNYTDTDGYTYNISTPTGLESFLNDITNYLASLDQSDYRTLLLYCISYVMCANNTNLDTTPLFYFCNEMVNCYNETLYLANNSMYTSQDSSDCSSFPYINPYNDPHDFASTVFSLYNPGSSIQCDNFNSSYLCQALFPTTLISNENEVLIEQNSGGYTINPSSSSPFTSNSISLSDFVICPANETPSFTIYQSPENSDEYILKSSSLEKQGCLVASSLFIEAVKNSENNGYNIYFIFS